MTFVKGQSGNPSGRPKKLLPDGRSLPDLAREHSADAFQALVDVATNAQSPAAARVSAATAILERGFGKPAQPIVGDEDEAPIQHAVDVSALSKETLRELAKVCA